MIDAAQQHNVLLSPLALPVVSATLMDALGGGGGPIKVSRQAQATQEPLPRKAGVPALSLRASCLRVWVPGTFFVDGCGQ